MNHFEELLIYKIPVKDAKSRIFCFALFTYNYLGKEIFRLGQTRSTCGQTLAVAQMYGQGGSVRVCTDTQS